jgi:hypothetical protein
VEALVARLEDSDAGIRSTAAEVIGALEPRALAAIPALIEALADRDPIVKYSAAVALGSFGRDGAAAAPALSQALLAKDDRNESQIVEPDIVAALRSVGADMAEVVVPLAEALEGGTDDARGRAERALGAVGAEALPVLAGALESDYDGVRRSAESALNAMDFPLRGAVSLTASDAAVLKRHYESALHELEGQPYVNPTFKTRFESALAWLAPQSTGPMAEPSPPRATHSTHRVPGWTLPAAALVLVGVAKVVARYRAKKGGLKE